MPSSGARADDPPDAVNVFKVVGQGVDDHQKGPADAADGTPTVAVWMRVWPRGVELVIENRKCVLERDAVLAKVGRRFAVVLDPVHAFPLYTHLCIHTGAVKASLPSRVRRHPVMCVLRQPAPSRTTGHQADGAGGHERETSLVRPGRTAVRDEW